MLEAALICSIVGQSVAGENHLIRGSICFAASRMVPAATCKSGRDGLAYTGMSHTKYLLSGRTVLSDGLSETRRRS